MPCCPPQENSGTLLPTADALAFRPVRTLGPSHPAPPKLACTSNFSHSCSLPQLRANSTAKHMDCPYRGSTCTDHVHPNVCMILSEACVWFAKHIFKIAFHSAKPARERMTVSCDSAHEVRARGASPPMRNRRANQAHA